ncbi:MAG: hypothetical protein LUD79_06470 [Oscillospiraceae bacterium]|nr:hypothetical protein [Oscillospiraceae bacterium]
MKTKVVAVAFLLLFILSGCGAKSGGNVDDVQIADWEPSELFSDEEVEAAFQTVKDYFSENFEGCTLTQLSYSGDTYVETWMQAYEDVEPGEIIVILSSFDVDSSGGDGSLNPDSTYDNWNWVLVQDDDGNWVHLDHGY